MATWKDLLGSLQPIFRIGLGKAALDASAITAPRTHVLPDQSGTLALTSQLGGGGSTPLQTLVTLPYSAGGMSTINVTSAGVTTGSIILASLAGTVENEADDIDDWEVSATPKVGSIDFNVSCPGPFCGQVAINYMIG